MKGVSPEREASCRGEPDNHHCYRDDEHAHCPLCQLAMDKDARACELCLFEEVTPLVYGPTDGNRWDGRSYPSLRLRRTLCPDPEKYVILFKAVHGEKSAVYPDHRAA